MPTGQDYALQAYFARNDMLQLNMMDSLTAYPSSDKKTLHLGYSSLYETSLIVRVILWYDCIRIIMPRMSFWFDAGDQFPHAWFCKSSIYRSRRYIYMHFVKTFNLIVDFRGHVPLILSIVWLGTLSWSLVMLRYLIMLPLWSCTWSFVFLRKMVYFS